MSDDKPKTPQQIVDDCNRLAQLFYKCQGYEVPEDFKMHESQHPQEVGCWRMAVLAYEEIQATDVEDCLADIQD